MNRIETVYGVLLPFAGTTVGAVCVYFMQKEINEILKKILTGFTSGVMLAASIWSLLIPAIEQSSQMGRLSVIPPVSGFWLGLFFLLIIDKILPHLNFGNIKGKTSDLKFSRILMTVLAVTLHNIPEGMAVGVVFAGWLSGNAGISAAGAMALSVGIAIQNFPEGAIISMPLHSEGVGKNKSFIYGMLSGIVEPFAAIITILTASHVVPLLPYFLGFAAGAMIYVVIKELIPETSEGQHSDIGNITFAAGFTIMLILDNVMG